MLPNHFLVIGVDSHCVALSKAATQGSTAQARFAGETLWEGDWHMFASFEKGTFFMKLKVGDGKKSGLFWRTYLKMHGRVPTGYQKTPAIQKGRDDTSWECTCSSWILSQSWRVGFLDWSNTSIIGSLGGPLVGGRTLATSGKPWNVVGWGWSGAAERCCPCPQGTAGPC